MVVRFTHEDKRGGNLQVKIMISTAKQYGNDFKKKISYKFWYNWLINV